MIWRPATKRPRNGQRVMGFFPEAAHYVAPMMRFGEYLKSVDCLHTDHGNKQPFSLFEAWIPESELIRAARAAAKGAK